MLVHCHLLLPQDSNLPSGRLITPHFKTNISRGAQVGENDLLFKQGGLWPWKWQLCQSETSNGTCTKHKIQPDVSWIMQLEIIAHHNNYVDLPDQIIKNCYVPFMKTDRYIQRGSGLSEMLVQIALQHSNCATSICFVRISKSSQSKLQIHSMFRFLGIFHFSGENKFTMMIFIFFIVVSQPLVNESDETVRVSYQSNPFQSLI